MASDEIKKNFEAVTEPSLSRWVQVLAWIIVTASVCWCGYATWREDTAASTIVGTVPMRELTLFCTHPEIGRWLPASGALASVTAGIGALASGRSSTRFLVAAAALVTAKALTLAIESYVESAVDVRDPLRTAKKGAAMTVGTKSVLFGAHCVLIHGFFVARGWSMLWGFPWDPRLWAAFFVHDLGYVGSPNMDGREGEEHVHLGAKIMGLLFGDPWADFSSTLRIGPRSTV